MTSITLNDGYTLDNIFTDYPTATTFIFNTGTYNMNQVLHITKPNIQFIGSSGVPKDVHFMQLNTNMDGLAIKADGFVMSGISIHNTYPGKIALTVANANNTNIHDCYIYGNSTTFSVYYAGKSVAQGPATLLSYYNNNLDSGNIFNKNVVYTDYTGDSIAFCLQKYGKFTSNIIRGGKVAVYMCQYTKVKNNKLYSSSTAGIFVSLPSYKIKIKKNVIKSSDQSSILIRKQVEHGDFLVTSAKITIKNNKIYNAIGNGIELNDCIDVYITNNLIDEPTQYGLYALRCNNITASFNNLREFKNSFWLESTSNCNIFMNQCFSMYPLESTNIVKIVNGSNNNKITNNVIKGQFTVPFSDIIGVSSNSLNNVINNNIFEKYLTYEEDLEYEQEDSY
jgi:hypothetical protein